MSKNTSVSLGDHPASFIEAQVSQGRFYSASDVMRAELIEGEQRGPATPFDFEAFIARKRATQSPHA